MITTLMLLAAVTVSSADENAILRLVLDEYVLDPRPHPDQLFIAHTMAEGAIDTIALRVAPATSEQIEELAASIAENNREPIALPELPARVRRVSAVALRGDDVASYDWERVDAKAVIEVSRPGFTRDRKMAVVRVVVREPDRAKQELYFLQLVDGQWQMK